MSGWIKHGSSAARVASGADVSLRTMACVCLLCALPVFTGAFPPLHDYPFHLARFDILAHYEASAFLQRIYNPPDFVLPNVGTDVLAMALAAILPVHVAGQVIVALTVTLQVSGVCALHYAIWRRLSVWPLLAVMFAYNFILLFGFLNYLFGVGLALWAVAIRCMILGRPAWMRATAGFIMALAVYFTHLAAFGMYALLLGALLAAELVGEARRVRELPDLRQLVVDGVGLILPLCFFAYSRTVRVAGAEPFGFWSRRAKEDASVTLFSFGDFSLDLIHLATWALLLVGITLLARVRLHSSVWPFLGLGALAFIAAPHVALTGWYVDTRIPIFVCLGALALTDIEARKAGAVRLLRGLVIGAAAVRTAAIAFSWHASQPLLKEVVGALQALPPGSVVFAASTDPEPRIRRFWDANWAPPLWHAVSYASLGRDVFVPAIWADPAQQPITVRAQFLPAYIEQGNNPTEVTTPEELQRVAARFSSLAGAERGYLLVLGDPAGPVASANLKQIAQGRRFALIALP